MSQHREASTPNPMARTGRILGPLVFLIALFLLPQEMGAAAVRVAAIALWMAIWWVTEAVPLAVTSMLPLVLFPLMAVRGVREVAPNYGAHIVFLFLGGFVLALAIQSSGLHRRLALRTLYTIGGSPRRLVWGFLLVTASLSMWLSNTATTLMMLPIAIGVADHVEDQKTPSRLLLAVAYGASIGGLGTLVGTPPNLVLAGMAPSLVPDLPALTFGRWMLFGVPLLLVLLPIAGLILARGLPRGRVSTEVLERERSALGPVRVAERRSAILFAATAVAWISRSGMTFGSFHLPGWSQLLPDPGLVTDAVPAIAAAILATLIPAGGGRRRPLVDWKEIWHGVPWGILLLFGGGLALADSVRASQLDEWLAGELNGLGSFSLPLVILSIALLTAFITNLTSDTATATLLMPVMAALAEAIHAPPYLLMATMTVAASCAFMLPVATPPNAIVMGSGRVTSLDLFREGGRLNVFSVLVAVVVSLTLGQLVLPQ